LSCSFGFLLGWADDGYGTNPILKFVGQFICANILTGTGLVIPLSDVFMIDYMFTVFWIIGIMNSVNMLDNMDGITGSSSLVICLTAFFITIQMPGINPIYSSMLIAVAGALIGFLFFNVSPAKMYMGDTGSMFLGVFLGGLSIDIIWSMETAYTGAFDMKQFLIPMMIFIVPIIDTLTVFIRRISRKQSPFIGGKDHTTHHLVYFKYTDKQVMYWFILANVVGGVISYLLFLNFDQIGIWQSISVIAFFLISFLGTQWYYDVGKRRNEMKEKQKVIKIEEVKKLKNKHA
jgi:UDP-GlcNAc:undecaprenyl-phosphate GlcNAc-1-phosphate transferase